MAVNMELFRQTAHVVLDAAARQKTSDRKRQKEQDDVFRTSVRELHYGLGTYYETLWDVFGTKKFGNIPRVRVPLGRPTRERVAPYVATFLRTTMGVDKLSPLFVVVKKDVLTGTMELSLGNIGVRIQTKEATLINRKGGIDVTVFDVHGRLEKPKDIRARDQLVKAFGGEEKDRLTIAQQLFAFVVDRTTEHLKNEAKRITTELK